jgi:Uri superfamily endonuclease
MSIILLPAHKRLSADMQKALSCKGIYVLWLRTTLKRSFTVGKAGHLPLTGGYLAYVGSAMGPGGLKSRLAHHLCPSPKPHWHIDYIKAHATIEQIWVLPQTTLDEHTIATALVAVGGRPLGRFGASDCSCDTHLFKFYQTAGVSRFRSVLYEYERPGKLLRFWIEKNR